MDIVRRLWLLRNALWSGTAPLARQLFDVVATATVVIVVASIGARTYDTSVARAEIAEALTLSKDPMMTATLHYAEYGRWPEPADPRSGESNGTFVDRVNTGPQGSVRFWFEAHAHPMLRSRRGTTAPIVGGDGATLRWQLVDAPEASDDSIDAKLVPYAWRLEPKEP